MLLLYKAVLFLAFPVVALCGTRLLGKGRYSEEFFPRQASLYWRGIAALMVVFAHLTIFLKENGVSVGIASLYEWVGGMGVLIFFFISGYGGGISLQNKTVDLKWLLTHILWLWIPVTLLRACFFFVEGRTDFLPYVIGIRDPEWFIAVLICIYVSVYIAKKILPRHYLLVVLLLNIGTGLAFYLMGLESRWYNGHLLYVFGLWLAQYYGRRLEAISRKKWLLCTALCGAGFLLTAIAFSRTKAYDWSALVKTLSGVFLSLTIVLLTQKCGSFSRMVCALGSMSLYIYIIHLHLYVALARLLPGKLWLVVWLSIVLALVASVLCTIAEKAVRARIRG